MKQCFIWVVLSGLPLTAWAHGSHDFHDVLSQIIHGLSHADVLFLGAALGVLGACVWRYAIKKHPLNRLGK